MIDRIHEVHGIRRQRARGFTLVEVMITVAIVAILSAVAVPQYSSYVTRGRLAEAFSSLGAVQPLAEQHWSNQRSYAGLGGLNAFPRASQNFDYALTAADAASYTVTATGKGSVLGFVFTIDQNGNRATTAAPSGWTANAGCWTDRKSGECIH